MVARRAALASPPGICSSVVCWSVVCWSVVCWPGRTVCAAPGRPIVMSRWLIFSAWQAASG